MKKRTLLLLLSLILAVGLLGCGGDPDTTEPHSSGQTDPATEVTMVVTADTIGQLENYPALKKADLTGSTCYAQILEYQARHPEVEVIYTVCLGNTWVDPTITALRLPEGSYDYDTLLENLQYLPQLTSLHLPGTSRTAQQVQALREAAPNMAISCTVMAGDLELDSQTTELDLSGLTAEEVDALLPKLTFLPQLEKIDLTDESGASPLTVDQVLALRQAVPQASIDYNFQLFGQTVNASAERVEFKEVHIGDQGEAQIRQALDLLTDCSYFLLDDCGIDYEILASIRDDYPDTEVVWRVWVWERSWLTDTDTLRAVYHVDDSNSGPFKYLTKVKYMDLGHNTEMSDISFCAYMPDLEIAILSGSPITDLTPLQNCKKLEFLELAWCGHLTDISPLAGCTGLKDLNLGHTRVDDLSPVKDLPLEMLSFVNSGNRVGFTASDWAQIQAQHPDCWITYEPLQDNSATPYSTGWRYTRSGGYTTIYRKVRDVFGYDAMAGNTPPTLTGDAAVTEVTQVVTSDTISGLDRYPHLEKADLSGSTCYDAIIQYIQSHPRVEVLYTVPLGGCTAKSTDVELRLSAGQYSYERLLAGLRYLPALKHLTLPATTLTSQQIAGLRAAYPALDINCTGKTAVDLSAVPADQAIDALAGYPDAVYVELMTSGGGSNFSIADVKLLQQTYPNITFHYTFDLFGKTVSTTDQRIEYVQVSIGNSGEAKLRQALDILQCCTYFKLDDCGIDYEILASVRDDYPHTEVVWRVWVWQRSWLTDTDTLRAVYHVDDSNSGPFKYLTKVKYMDLGHNTEMSDISFCAYMPDLEIAILSGSPITDLTPLQNCKKLEFLEIAWCGYVKDVSPLAGCHRLRYLNVGHTRVKDFSALTGLDLKMLSYVNSGNRVGFTEYHWEQIQEQFPTCWITFNPLADNNASPYSTGWRYKAAGGYTPIYRKVRDVFGYDYMVV